MDKRLTIFMVVSVAIILANQLIYLLLFPPPPAPPKAPPVVAEADANDDDPAAGEPDLKDRVAPVARPAAPAEQERPAAERLAANAEQPAMSQTRVTLGSADPASPFRMLVVANNRGASIERVQLNSPRYLDTEDRSGFLAYLAASDAPASAGAQVNVVGPGTPADLAGLKSGDVITAIDNVAVPNAAVLTTVLAGTRSGQAIELSVLRGNEPVKLKAELRRQPLSIIRPEWQSQPVETPDLLPTDPASFLMTLQQFDDRVLDDGDGELGGVDLESGNWEVVESSAATVVFRKTLPRLGLDVLKTYRLEKVPEEELSNADYPAYGLQLEIAISNVGDARRSLAYRLDGPSGLPTEGAWYAIKVSHNWSSAGLRDVIVRFQGGTIDQISPFQASAKDFKKNWANSPLDFIAVDAQYFSAALLPEKEQPGDVWFASVRPRRVGAVTDKRPNLTNMSFRLDSVPVNLNPGDPPLVRKFQLFAGPKRPELLASYSLGELVYYGWFGFVSRPLLSLLHAFYAVVGNYGLAIVLLTVMVRMCMFPVSRKQAMGAQKMAELQPEIKRLNEKYKNEPDKKMKAQQELFRAHKYNPLGGCLLGFVQIPIFMGLYRSLQVDVELRQMPLFSESIRWASNLVAPDMLWDWTAFVPDFVAHGTGFFALGPYFNLLPVITIVLMIISQKMTLPPPTDEQSALQQKMMQYMMIFMGVMFFKVAAGLCVYFITGSIWSITERKMLPKPNRPAGAPTDTSAVSAASSRPAANGSGGTSNKKKQRG